MDDGGGDAEGGAKLYYHLTALAETDEGYKNLIQLSSSLAYMEGYYYKPRVDCELLDEHQQGLIVTSGCLGGHVLQHLLRDDYEAAVKTAGRLQDIFGRDSFFIEMQDHGIPEQHRTNPQLLEIAKHLQAPLVATNDSHYVAPRATRSPTTPSCACRPGSQMSDPDRFKFHGDEHYLKSSHEMRHLFDELPEACDNTLWIAERADVTIEFGKPQLPTFPLPEGFDTDTDYLRHLTMEGARQRWGAEPHATHRRAAGLRAAGHRLHGVLVVLPHRLGPHQARARQRHPGRSGPRERGRLRGGLHALDHRPRSRSSTTSSSSASSTRAASRCPTSTWTSTPATGTR